MLFVCLHCIDECCIEPFKIGFVFWIEWEIEWIDILMGRGNGNREKNNIFIKSETTPYCFVSQLSDKHTHTTKLQSILLHMTVLAGAPPQTLATYLWLIGLVGGEVFVIIVVGAINRWNMASVRYNSSLVGACARSFCIPLEFRWFTCSFVVQSASAAVVMVLVLVDASQSNDTMCASHAVEVLRFGLVWLYETYDAFGCNINSSILVEVLACDDKFVKMLKLLVATGGCCTDGLICYQTTTKYTK